jgi:hypothetical protein
VTYLLGHAPDSPCAVCGLSPVALEAVVMLPRLATCARCGLVYEIADADGVPFDRAILTISPGFIGLFQRYYRETKRKLGIPAYMLEEGVSLGPEILERTLAMGDWLQAHGDLVAAATAPLTWPYAAVSLEAVEDKGTMRWLVHAPPAGLAGQVMVPFKPEGLPPGTLVTVLIPLHPTEARAGTPADVQVEEPEGC